MTLLATHNLGRRFGHLQAVSDVSFAVDEGEVVGLLGANGAGKTTTIRMTLGLITPTQGSITVFDEAPSRKTRAQIGYVPQSLGLWSDLTATENVEFISKTFGAPPPSADEIASILDSPNLASGLATVPVRNLPLGMQRRIAFLAATNHNPKLLILDEPTSGVGALSRARLWDTIRHAADRGTGVMVSTHYMDEAEQCDRVVVMAAGRVVAQGTPASLTSARHVVAIESHAWKNVFETLIDSGMRTTLAGSTIRVLEPHLADLAEIVAQTDPQATVTLQPANLEEVFVELAAPPVEDT